jgi:uncharacterized alkaline shock family protein YloU
MAKEKDFLLEDTGVGHLYVDDNVIKMVSNLVSKKVDGVYNLTGKLVDVFNSNRKGVDIKSKEETLFVEVSVGVKEDYIVIDVARKVQQAVILALREQFEVENVTVDVVVRELFIENEMESFEE